MSERERLIDLLKNAKKYATNTMAHLNIDEAIDISYDDLQADYLLENGVIVPPVKVGDTIYMIVGRKTKITREYFRFIKKTKLTFLNLERVLKDWGKTVFLTQKQAEKALKGGAERWQN